MSTAVCVKNSETGAFDSWSSGKCVYVCKLCCGEGRFTDGLAFWHHVLQVHDMSCSVYRHLHPNFCLEKVQTDCGICGVTVTHDPGKITAHLARDHGAMELREYYDDWVAEHTDTFYETSRFFNPGGELEWFNDSVYKCAHCEGTTGTPEAMVRHAKYDHKLKNPSKGDFRVVRESFVRCHICNVFVVHHENALVHHLKVEHGVDGDVYAKHVAQLQNLTRLQEQTPAEEQAKKGCSTNKKRFWFEGCLFTCLLCETYVVATKRAIIRHIDSVHKEDCINGDQDVFATTESFHECRSCKLRISRNRVAITSHVKNKHGMALEDYEQRYIKEEEGGGRIAAKPIAKKKTEVNKRQWYNGCVYRCLECDWTTFCREDARTHAKLKHYNVNAFEMTRERIYRCEICKEDLVHDKEDLRVHLLRKHDIRLALYHAKYVTKEEKATPKQLASIPSTSGGGNGFSDLLKGGRGSSIAADDGTVIHCPLCNGALLSLDNLDAHLEERHRIDDKVTRTSVRRKIEMRAAWKNFAAGS